MDRQARRDLAAARGVDLDAAEDEIQDIQGNPQMIIGVDQGKGADETVLGIQTEGIFERLNHWTIAKAQPPTSFDEIAKIVERLRQRTELRISAELSINLIDYEERPELAGEGMKVLVARKLRFISRERTPEVLIFDFAAATVQIFYSDPECMSNLLKEDMQKDFERRNGKA